MDLEGIADELYGLAPADFTAARNERASAARTAGERELARRIQALRRPTLSAWVSNLLVRRRPEQVQPLVSLGEGMRQAHRDLDGEQLRALGRRQHDLVGALARQAKQLAADAGHPVGDGVQQEVEGTLHAVLADPEAARAWAAGRLAKPLSAPVGFTAATTPDTVPHKARDSAAADAGEKARDEQRAKLARAEKDATAAEQQAAARDEELAQAETRLREAETEVAVVAERLKEAKERQKAAREGVGAARERAREAGAAARKARRRADDAAAHTDGR